MSYNNLYRLKNALEALFCIANEILTTDEEKETLKKWVVEELGLTEVVKKS